MAALSASHSSASRRAAALGTVLAALTCCLPAAQAVQAAPVQPTAAETAELPAKPTLADVIRTSRPSDWRPLDPANTLYMDIPAGRVVIELAPAFAPNHVRNIRNLVRERYFDGLAITRSQDNWVVQWGEHVKPLTVARGLPGEALLSEDAQNVVAELEGLAERDAVRREGRQQALVGIADRGAELEWTLDRVLGGLVANHAHRVCRGAVAAGLGQHVEILACDDLGPEPVEVHPGA